MCINSNNTWVNAHKMSNLTHFQLYEIAESQAGYFTAAQARQVGFSSQLLSYHARTGLVERISRGIYRLRRFPGSPHEDLFNAQLRAGPDSAISHDSALALYELSDILPSEVHVTVPGTASRRRSGMRQHTNHITLEDVTRREGLRVTTVSRTIADVARSGLSEDRVRQAIEEAVDRGLIGARELRETANKYGGRTKRIVTRFLHGSAQ